LQLVSDQIDLPCIAGVIVPELKKTQTIQKKNIVKCLEKPLDFSHCPCVGLYAFEIQYASCVVHNFYVHYGISI
jgi:hypothetical protein